MSGSPSLWTQLPQSSRAPCDRYKHACCSYHGHVYVLGGRESSSLRDFWKYSVAFNKWTQMNCTGDAAPEELEEHSMVAHEGFLYVFGGLLDSSYSCSSSALWVFDLMKQKWVLCQGKTSSPKNLVPSNRKGHSAAVLGSTMLVYGGFIDIRGSSQDFWALDFDTMSWSLLSSSQHDSAGPGPRHSHSAVVYQGCMYLYGGLKGLREQRDLWRWNSSSFTWSCLKNMSGPPRLIGHSAVLYKDHMLVFGGGQSVDCPQSSLWSYSFCSHTWTQVASLPGSTAPTRIHHCSTGLGPSYRAPSTTCSTSPLQQGRARPFQNRCYPDPKTGTGSWGAIELETFSTSSSTLDLSTETKEDLMTLSCLSFENKAFRKQWSCTQEDLRVEEEDGDISLHLPDQLLVLGGRPCVRHQLISVWQMTLTHS